MNKLFFFLVFALALTACTDSINIDNNPKSIKVLVWNQQYFDDNYGEILKRKFPDTTFEVITLQDAFVNGKSPTDLINKMIVNKEPDLIILQEQFFQKFLDKNIFLDLSTRLEGDNLKISDINLGVLERGTSSDGKLLGVATSFHSQFIIRNMDRFKEKGIELESNYSSLKSISDTITLLTDIDKGELGLAIGSGSVWGTILAFANSDGLKLADINKKQLLINSTSWESVASEIIKLIQSKSLSYTSFPNPQSGDLFTQGKAAMTIGDDSYIGQLMSNNDQIPFKWDFTLIPNNSLGQRAAPSNSNEYLAIRAGAHNEDFLINVLRELLGKDIQAIILAKKEIPALKPTSLDPKLQLYMSLFDNNINFSNNLYSDMLNMPEDLLIHVSEIAENEFNEVLSGSITVKEALDSILDKSNFYWGTLVKQ